MRLAHSIDSIGAKRVVLDTLESLFASLPNESILRAELRRLFRWLKARGVTTDQISTRRVRVVKYRGSLHGTNEYPFLIDDDGIVVLAITSILHAARPTACGLEIHLTTMHRPVDEFKPSVAILDPNFEPHVHGHDRETKTDC